MNRLLPVSQGFSEKLQDPLPQAPVQPDPGEGEGDRVGHGGREVGEEDEDAPAGVGVVDAVAGGDEGQVGDVAERGRGGQEERRLEEVESVLEAEHMAWGMATLGLD